MALARIPTSRGRIRRALTHAVVSTTEPLQQHHYTLFDLQYLFLFVLLSFCYGIMDKPVWFKLPIALTSVALLIPRRTRQFMLPFLAIAAWLILFYCCRFIPAEWRPHIFTSVLPALENILYGGSISEMLAKSTSPFKDILAWIPYGVLHYVLPIVTAILIVCFGQPGTLPVFARTFGYLNIAGVLTQILFPCAPPWYETRYGGFQPATYTMPGDPGGLARVDDILGVHMYKTTFTASPLVFGAFPSLHSADAWMLAFFLVYVFGPRSIPFALTYVFWIWWATMYLGHHYVVDLVGGAAYAVVAFYIGSFFLPPVLPSDEPDLEGKRRGSHELGEAMDQPEKETLFQAPESNMEAETGSSSSRGHGQHVTKGLDLGQDDEDEEAAEFSFGDAKPLSFSECGVDVMEMSSVVVVNKRQTTTTLAGLEIKEAGRDLTHSGPWSPTDSDHSSTSSTSSTSTASSASSISSSSESSTTTVSSWTQRRRNQRVSARSSVRQSWNGWQGYESWVEVLATVNSPRTSPKTSPKSSPAHSPRSSTAQLEETVV